MEWRKALDADDPDALWRIWCGMAEGYLAQRCLPEGRAGRQYKGRGLETCPRWSYPSAAQCAGEVGAQTVQQRK
eukprot:2427239-Karenia_brevis.AAC.1